MGLATGAEHEQLQSISDAERGEDDGLFAVALTQDLVGEALCEVQQAIANINIISVEERRLRRCGDLGTAKGRGVVVEWLVSHWEFPKRGTYCELPPCSRRTMEMASVQINRCLIVTLSRKNRWSGTAQLKERPHGPIAAQRLSETTRCESHTDDGLPPPLNHPPLGHG